MKHDSYFGFYRHDEDQIQKIWNNAIIVFDTNMLLNSYKMSADGCDQFFDVLSKIKPRLWLPHQVGKEFHRNRKSVIEEQLGALKTTKKESFKLLDSLITLIEKSSLRYRNELTEKCYEELKTVKINLEKIFSEYPDRIERSNFFDGKELKKQDMILEKISKIFDTGTIGNEYNYERLLQIYEEGEKRYSLNIPPGYMDALKKKDYRKFGDLIIWYQMIDKANLEKKPIIFITEDNKEDWWDRNYESKLPQPELLFEFINKTEQDFVMYTYKDFVEAAKIFIADLPDTETAIEEMNIIGEGMRKKLQVFISSTYTDLIEERQAAVQAVLTAGHIPAGMELFKSGDENQREIIKRWIDISDVYILILGGRYGSIDEETGKSYTHWEYDYAGEVGKERFSIVISEEALRQKGQANIDFIERFNYRKYEEFRKLVLSKMSTFFTDERDIKLAILERLSEYIKN